MRSLRRLLGSESGGATVEFAIASVVLFTILFGILQFGQAAWRYNTVASLAKDAARYASVHGSSSGSPVDSAAVQAYVSSRAFGFAVIARTNWPDGGSKAAGKRVRVKVEETFTPTAAPYRYGTLTLKSTAEVVIAR